MELANKVYSYYFDNKHLLEEDKLFHFGTRIAAWTGKPEVYDILRKSRDFIVQPSIDLTDTLTEIINRPQTGKRNAHELRQPFFNKYPLLYGAHLTLFRVRHLESVYGIDARPALFSVVDKDKLIKLKQDLLNDIPAMMSLSTFAINYLYLLEKIIFNDQNPLPINDFLEIGYKYKTENIQDLQLLIYFYTHCIIGESNFYTLEIPTDKLPIYHQMLAYLEKIITDNYQKINLDNKLEFLVCARICNFDTKLFDKIYDECDQSISNEGTFIIDIHNQNAQNERNNFARSEHRNVLFIMSSTAYQPHSTLTV